MLEFRELIAGLVLGAAVAVGNTALALPAQFIDEEVLPCPAIDSGPGGRICAGLAVTSLQWTAQTITFGRSGMFRELELGLWADDTAIDGFTVSIRPLVDGRPSLSSAPLFERTYSLDGVPRIDTPGGTSVDLIRNLPFFSIPMTGRPIRVETGDELAIILTRGGNPYGTENWLLWAAGDDQVVGTSYVCSDPPLCSFRPWGPFSNGEEADLTYRTYVVAEPASIYALGVALLGVVGLARSRGSISYPWRAVRGRRHFCWSRQFLAH